MPTVLTSRVFMNGNSQALRIPQPFRLDVQRVEITRTAHGDLLVHPLPDEPEHPGKALLAALEALGELGPELATLPEEDRREQPAPQEREPF